MSVAAWVKPNYTQGSPEFTVVSKGKSFILSINNIIDPRHIAKFAIFDGIKWTTVESYSEIPDDSWTHLTARFNKTAIEIYVNGTLEGTILHDGIPFVSERGQIELKTLQEITSYKDIVIGATITADMASSAYNMFSGLIDGVQLYDHQLQPEDVALIYQQTMPIVAPPIPPPPVGKPQPAMRYRILNATRAEEELPVSISVEELNEDLKQMTVSAWIRPNYTGGSSEYTVVSKENSWMLSLNNLIPPEKIVKFSAFDGITWHTVSGSTPIEGWTHLAGVFNNASLILYVNGTIDGRLDRGPPEAAGSFANVTIGAYESTLRDHKISNYFSGPIVDVTVYKHAMIDHEVEEEFSNMLKVYLSTVYQQNTNMTTITLEEQISIDAKSKPTLGEYSLSGLHESLGLLDKITILVNNQTVPIEEAVVSGNSTILAENLGLGDKITALLYNQTVNLAGMASNLTHSEIEIGKMVNWTQTVMLNGTEEVPNILVELPADAQNIQVEIDDGTGNYTDITKGVIEIFESAMESGENSTENKMSFREMAKMLNVTELIPLDLAEMKDLKEVKQKDKPTKALLINDTAKHRDYEEKNKTTKSANNPHSKIKQFNSNVNLITTSNTGVDIRSIILNNTQNATEFNINFTTEAPNATEYDYYQRLFHQFL